MIANNEEKVVGAVSTAMKIATKVAPTVGRLLAVVAVPAALFALPQAALADNECGLQVLPGDPETVACDPNDTYADGITYSSNGSLTLEVAPNDSVDLEVNEAGVNVTGNGADNIVWDSGGFTNGDITGSGIVLDYLSDTGSIDILIGGDIQGLGDATHAIRAESTGGGDVSVTTLGNVNPNAGTSSNPVVGDIGIEAVTAGGDITLTTEGNVSGDEVAIRAISGSGNISIETNGTVGEFGIAAAQTAQHGIQAQTGGTGSLTITASGNVRVSSSAGVAAIDATTGTGLLTVNVASGSGSVNGQSGTAIRTDAGGDAVINIASGRTVNASGTALDLTAAGEITVNNAGAITAQVQDSATIRASGVSLTLNNDGIIRTRMIDFSGLENGYVFNNNAGARWQFSAGPSPLDGVSELGTGVFNNAGTIELGIREVVMAPGTAFTGTGDSVLEVQAALNVAGQSSCSAPATASCLDLTGGSTSGQTQILVDRSNPSGLDPKSSLTQAANPGVLLVDVSGGTSAAEHFVLHPDSDDYATDPKYGAVLDTGTGGLLDYALLYNPDTQEHVLTSVPQQEAIEYVTFIDQALSIWHTTSDAVAGRQADLRQGAVGGGWARAISEQIERESVPTLTTHGNSFTYDQDYTLDTWSAIGGYDLTSSDNHVIGLHAGFVYSTLEYDNSDTGTRDKIKGATLGAYAGWWNEAGLTLDGTLNTNVLRLSHKVDMEDFERSDSDVRSIGLRGEAGWLFPLAGEAFYVQPLVTAAYVHTNIETLELRQNKLNFEDAESRRAALGVRVGGEMELSRDRFGKLGYWLTARAWEEYAEDGNVQFLTDGDPLKIEDDTSGTFEEVGFGVSLASPDENLNVFLSGNIQSGDQTDSTNVTIGARLRW